MIYYSRKYYYCQNKSEESADNSNKDSNNENSYSKNNLNQKWKASQNIYYFCK